jgi:hypothetical protein
MSQIRGRTQIKDLTINRDKLEAAFNLQTNQLEEGADFLQRDGSVALTANLPAGGFKLTGLGTPTAAGDSATKGYVDGLVQGLDTKASARVMSTTNITLTGLQTIDGVTLVANDRVLLVGQTTGAQNGLWVAQSGSWTRPTDWPAAGAGSPNAYVFVEEGTVNADTGWT